MTYKDFLKAFKKVASPRAWKVLEGGLIRHRSGHCPLSFVAFKVDKDTSPCEMGGPLRTLGINARTAVRIIDAADGVGNRPITRKALLSAIGR